MPFRTLTKEELQPLESDFISYLALHGITGEEYKSKQENDPSWTQHWIDNFSQMVWLKIFSNKRYINLDQKGVKYFFDFLSQKKNVLKFERSEIEPNNMIGFQSLDFTKSREEDMFELMEQGGFFSEGKEYKQGLMMWAEIKAK